MIPDLYRVVLCEGTSRDLAEQLARQLNAQARPKSGPWYEPVAYVDTPQRDALLVVLRRTRRGLAPV